MTQPGEHEWFKSTWMMKWECCRLCGFIRRMDGKPNKPCRGPVRVELRDAEPKGSAVTKRQASKDARRLTDDEEKAVLEALRGSSEFVEEIDDYSSAER